MIGVTLFGILTPMFYFVMRRFSDGRLLSVHGLTTRQQSTRGAP
jgi:hypothetical protein